MRRFGTLTLIPAGLELEMPAVALLQLGSPISRLELAKHQRVAAGTLSTCKLRVDDPYVSAIQFRLHRGPAFWTIAADDSKNPTYLNGQALAPGDGRPLIHGSIIRAGMSTWIATSEPDNGLYIAGRNQGEFYLGALLAFGSCARAAAAIGVAEASFRRRLRRLPGIEEDWDYLMRVSGRRKRRLCPPTGVPILTAMVGAGALHRGSTPISARKPRMKGSN